MNRILISLLIVLNISYSVSAQMRNTTISNSEFRQFFSVGPRLGLNIANLSGVDDLKAKAGLTVGAFMLYSFQEHFGISADMLYSMEGAKFTDLDINGNITTKTENDISLSYLRIPLLANVFFGEYGNHFRPKVSLGPSLGLLLSAKNKFKRVTSTSAVDVITVEDKENVQNNFKGVDLGAVIGAGFNYRLAESVWWNFDLRYYIGATDINDRPTVNYNSKTIKNNSFSVSLGLGIGL